MFENVENRLLIDATSQFYWKKEWKVQYNCYYSNEEDMPQFLADNEVTIVASLPCYSSANVDKQVRILSLRFY